MTLSLRGRLVLTLLSLAAVGLLATAAITYASQRSFLLRQIDEQTRSAQPAIAAAIAQPTSAGTGRLPGVGSDPGLGVDADGPDRRGRRPGPASFLPPGTYGERRSATGTLVGTPVRLTFGEGFSAPALSDRLAREGITTVSSVDGSVDYRVRVLADRFGGGFTVVAIPLNGVHATLRRLLAVEGIVVAGVLLILGLLSWVLVRRDLRPLDRVGRTAGAIAAGDLTQRVDVVDPRTEIGRLGVAFNDMVGALQRAFAQRELSEARLRQFLSDASHELRTPLTSIRAYAELHRLGQRSPQETAHAMGRVEEEAARMGTLVEDLLTLARLDEVRERGAETEPVDLSDLALDAVADARAVAPDREMTPELPVDSLVLGNPDELRQVLGNLLRNAIVHTPPGTPIEVSVIGEDAEVVLRVRDHGPGLGDVDTAVLFERFWRSEAGRERGRAGAGLGLAIVAGIVAAHGGSVRAENAPGGGALFEVRLPALEA